MDAVDELTTFSVRAGKMVAVYQALARWLDELHGSRHGLRYWSMLLGPGVGLAFDTLHSPRNKDHSRLCSEHQRTIQDPSLSLVDQNLLQLPVGASDHICAHSWQRFVHELGFENSRRSAMKPRFSAQGQLALTENPRQKKLPVSPIFKRSTAHSSFRNAALFSRRVRVLSDPAHSGQLRIWYGLLSRGHTWLAPNGVLGDELDHFLHRGVAGHGFEIFEDSFDDEIRRIAEHLHPIVKADEDDNWCTSPTELFLALQASIPRFCLVEQTILNDVSSKLGSRYPAAQIAISGAFPHLERRIMYSRIIEAGGPILMTQHGGTYCESVPSAVEVWERLVSRVYLVYGVKGSSSDLSIGSFRFRMKRFSLSMPTPQRSRLQHLLVVLPPIIGNRRFLRTGSTSLFDLIQSIGRTETSSVGCPHVVFRTYQGKALPEQAELDANFLAELGIPPHQIQPVRSWKQSLRDFDQVLVVGFGQTVLYDLIAARKPFQVVIFESGESYRDGWLDAINDLARCGAIIDARLNFEGLAGSIGLAVNPTPQQWRELQAKFLTPARTRFGQFHRTVRTAKKVVD